MVVFSISVDRFATIFFYFHARFDYYIENNTRQCICGAGAMRFLPVFLDAAAVVSAAGDALDAQIAARARRHRIPVNVVDRPELSTFIFPAIVDRGEVVVAIGTGGASPVLARRLRELIEALLPARIGDLAQLIGRHRSRFAAVPRAL